MPCGRCHLGRPLPPRKCLESMTMGRSRCVQASPRASSPLGHRPTPCRHPDRSRHLGRHARCFEEDSTSQRISCLSPRKRTLYHQDMPCPNSIPPPPCPNCPHFKSDIERCASKDDFDDDDFVITDCSTQTRGSCCNQKENIILSRECPTMTEPCAPMLSKTTITSRAYCPFSSSSCGLEPRERKRRVSRKYSRKPRWVVTSSSQTEKTCVGGGECSVCTTTDTSTAEECTGISCDAMNEDIQVCIPADFEGASCFPSDHVTTCKAGEKIERTKSSCASCNTEQFGVDTSCATSRKCVSFNPSCCSMNDRKRTGPNFSCTGDRNQSPEQSYIDESHTCLCTLKNKGNAKKCVTHRSDEDNSACSCTKKESMDGSCSNVIKNVSAKNSSEGSGCCCKISDYFNNDNDDGKQCECVYPPEFSQLGCTGKLSGNCSCGMTDKPSNTYK